MASKKPSANPTPSIDSLFSPEGIKDFIRFIEKVDIAEVEIKSKDKSLLLSKKPRSYNMTSAQPQMPAVEHRPSPMPEAPKTAPAENVANVPKATRPTNIVEITAPLVGTFYRYPEPGAQPFIKVGDSIEPGKVVCLIEAMKIFNEIKSEIRGIVKEVCLENEQPVEFGQALYLVEVK